MKTRRTILIIEDDRTSTQILDWFLKDQRYNTLCSESAEHGLSVLDTHPVDLVLMDIRLPGMNGIEATRLLKGNPQKNHIPIIAITAHALKKEIQAILVAGADEAFAKPIDHAILIKTIEAYLEIDDHKCLE